MNKNCRSTSATLKTARRNCMLISSSWELKSSFSSTLPLFYTWRTRCSSPVNFKPFLSVRQSIWLDSFTILYSAHEMIFRAKSSHSLSEPQITVYLCNWSVKKHILNSKLVDEKLYFVLETDGKIRFVNYLACQFPTVGNVKQSAFIFSLNLSCIVSHFIQRTGLLGNLMPCRHLSQDRS